MNGKPLTTVTESDGEIARQIRMKTRLYLESTGITVGHCGSVIEGLKVFYDVLED